MTPNVTLFTSNFRIAGRLEQAVSISRGKPKWYKGKTYDRLAPRWELVRMKDEEGFMNAYMDEVLSKLDPLKVVGELGDGAIMLCWEPPGKFCHRLVVAAWLKNELGLIVPEYQPPPGEKKTKARKAGNRYEIPDIEPTLEDQLALF